MHSTQTYLSVYTQDLVTRHLNQAIVSLLFFAYVLNKWHFTSGAKLMEGKGEVGGKSQVLVSIF
jgi:hypothetical protein